MAVMNDADDDDDDSVKTFVMFHFPLTRAGDSSLKKEQVDGEHDGEEESDEMSERLTELKFETELMNQTGEMVMKEPPEIVISF